MATELRHSAFLGHQQRRTWYLPCPLGLWGPTISGLSAMQQGAAAVEARVFHLLRCDGFTDYTAAPTSKSCKVRHVFFWKLWQEIMHPAYLAWFVCWVMMNIMSLQLANCEHGRTFLLNWSIVVFSMYDARKHIMLFQHVFVTHNMFRCLVSRHLKPIKPTGCGREGRVLFWGSGTFATLMQQWMCFSSQACRSPFSASGV